MCSETTTKANIGRADKIDPANVPMEAKALLMLVFAFSISRLPIMLSAMDTDADINVDVIAQPLFPTIMSVHTLAMIRLGFAAILLSTTFVRFYRTGHNLSVPYLKQSKVVKRLINADRIRSQIMFTQWCWNTLTISFLLNGFIALQYHYHNENPNRQSGNTPLLLQNSTVKLAIMIFEIAAPTSMLVSTVTKYVLWPQALKSNPQGSINLRKPIAILQHNLNVVGTLMEVGVLSRIQVRPGDYCLALLYGIAYISFMYGIRSHHKDPEGKRVREPQFVYFFFDTTLGTAFVVKVLLVLMFVLETFYGLFTIVDDVLVYLGGGVCMNLAVVGALATFFCRFRD